MLLNSSIKEHVESVLSESTPRRSSHDIVGYDFAFAEWEKRYAKELKEGKIVNVSSEISINKQSIQSVENSIYTRELGELADTDKDIREFSCDCGALYGRFYEGMPCPECGTIVKCQFNKDIKRVGWIDIAPFVIINPNAYELIGKVCGFKNLQKILQYEINIDLDGNLSSVNTQDDDSDDEPASKKSKSVQKQNVPFANLGMIEFRNNFDNILSYYADIKGAKEEAKYLIAHKNEIFSSKIPVSSIYLRPTFTSSKKRSVSFDKLNAIYVKMLTNASLLRRTMKKEVDLKRSLNVLFDIQTSLQDLYATTIKCKLSGKTKLVRGSILGNRMNFSARMVIRSFVGPYTGMDKAEMSYKGFLELNLLEVINALMRGYGDPSFVTKTVYEVMEYVQRAQYSDEIDPIIWDVMQKILHNRPSNPIVILRPPSLSLGSLQYFEVVRIIPDAKDKTLSVPLSSLPELNGDFDGDCLTVFSLKEKCVAEAFKEGLSPKRLLIDRSGDNYFNSNFSLIKDEITQLVSILS